MALAAISIRDIFDLDGTGTGTGDGIHDPDLVGGWEDQAPGASFILAGAGNTAHTADQVYHAALDRLYVKTAQVSAGGNTALAYIDPLFLDGVVPASDWLTDDETTPGMFVGEWDLTTGLQRLYVGLTSGFAEYDPVSGTQISTDAYPAVGLITHRTKAASVDGYYDAFDAISEITGDAVFFESLGYILRPAIVRYQGSTLTGVFVKIFLDNAAGTAAAAAAGVSVGDAIPFGSDEADGEGIPVRYTASPNVWQETEFGGDDFVLNWVQFVPDDDSTPTAPKGFLFFAQGGANLVTGGIFRQYAKIVDFNPTNAPGTPTRVHKRERLLTRVEIADSDSAPNATGLYGAGHSARLFWHRPSRTIRQLHRRSGTGNTPVVDQMQGVVYGTAPALEFLTPPAAETVVESGRTARFSSLAFGSLGEKIAGQDVAWSLERVSTDSEVLTGAFTPATTSTVANFPIDPLVGVAEGTLVVRGAAGTVLAETTDYTVVLATGVITWVTDQSGGPNTPEADYQHRTTPATPPHGTLLIATSKSDEDGRATTEVQYADNGGSGPPADELDKLTATST